MTDLFQIPENFSELDDAALAAWINEATETAQRIATSPDEFAEDFTPAELLEAATAGVTAIETAKDELASRVTEAPAEAAAEETPTEDVSEALAALATRAQAAADEAAETTAATEEAAAAVEPVEPEAKPAAVEAAPPVEAVTAAAPAAALRPLPSRAQRSAPAPDEITPRIALTAAAEGLGYGLGAELGDESEASAAIARMMVRRRGQFGSIPEGTHGDTIPIARAEWDDLYPAERRLGDDPAANFAKVEAVTASALVTRNFEARIKKDGADSLVASGGLCAPLTPYYGLDMVSVDDRPVRASLASFNADRGGINYARPAGLGVISGGVGVKTMAQDAAGGSAAVKTCQVVDCPPFTSTVIQAIYHCLQFGNIGSRTFPELLEQWNRLVLAAQARIAESLLLDGIKAASTKVTAAAGGLGASASLPSQIITAANGMRSRNRMAPDAVLRVMLPNWVLDLLVSDVYRSQFQRFDMTPEKFVSLLRSHNVEPGFYIDGPSTGVGQVWGAQAATTLLPFPTAVQWAIFPEGSFLFLDGGMLEMGLVRDSVLNRTNDFQIFGETFENVAFTGIESIWVTSTTCDSGQVNAPVNAGCITY